MGRRTKEERAAKEAAWQVENDLPNATCCGEFYIWNGGGYEKCACRDNCGKHKAHKEAYANQTLYHLPTVKFYYVDGFRNCKFRN